MIKNKLYALALLAIGGVMLKMTADATVLVLLSVIAVPMFFSKREWIL